MILLQSVAFMLALTPCLVSAAIFPPGTLVKMIDAKGFKKAMKQDQTSVVAFVAPWCGHCQRMAPEYSKAAVGLHPLVPMYAVDCDDEKNKPLCAEQGVQGFPTIKLFPRGEKAAPIPFNHGERTAKAFFNWASQSVPDRVRKLRKADDIPTWVSKNSPKPRALLLTKEKKVPLLWKVLANKYQGQISFAAHRDEDETVASGFGAYWNESKGGKVFIYPADGTTPALYEGQNKLNPLEEFFSSVLDGTVNLKLVEVTGEQPIDTDDDSNTTPTFTSTAAPADMETASPDSVEDVADEITPLEAAYEADISSNPLPDQGTFEATPEEGQAPDAEPLPEPLSASHAEPDASSTLSSGESGHVTDEL